LGGEEYGGCLCYEHGQAGSCLKPVGSEKNHCFHAHIHCVPTQLRLSEIIDLEFNAINLVSYEEFRSTYKVYPTPYLLVDDVSLKMYHINKEIRSQYLRYKLALAINKPDLWNWVERQGWDSIYAGKNKLEKYFL